MFTVFEFARIMLSDETEVRVHSSINKTSYVSGIFRGKYPTLHYRTFLLCYCHFYARLYPGRAPIKIVPFVCPSVLHSVSPPLAFFTNVTTFTECVLRVKIEVFNIHCFVYSVDTLALTSRQSD